MWRVICGSCGPLTTCPGSARSEATYYLSSRGGTRSARSSTRGPFVLLLVGYIPTWAAMVSWAVVGGWMAAAYYVTFGVGPFLLWGPLYRRRCEPDQPSPVALASGLRFLRSTCV